MECTALTDASLIQSERIGVPRCAECGEAISGKRATLFCSAVHKTVYRNRMKVRGQTILSFVLAAAQARHAPSDAGRYATRQMWALAAKWNREDREAGRMPALSLVELRRAVKWQACDQA